MPRNRIVQQQLFRDESLEGVPAGAVAYLIGLSTEADDYGNVVFNPKLIHGLLFSMIQATIEDIEQWNVILTEKGILTPYTVDGKQYAHITGWDEHNSVMFQVINRKSARRNPEPPLSNESSVSPHGVLSESSVSTHGPTRTRTITRTGNRKPVTKKPSTTTKRTSNSNSVSNTNTARAGTHARTRTRERAGNKPGKKLPRYKESSTKTFNESSVNVFDDNDFSYLEALGTGTSSPSASTSNARARNSLAERLGDLSSFPASFSHQLQWLRERGVQEHEIPLAEQWISDQRRKEFSS